ncbi:hypothetical protein PTKIN_Ptkin05aG0067200 [Pterospermum kingtungense]
MKPILWYKENHKELSQPLASPKRGKAAGKGKQSKQSFENDLQEMLQKLRIEKEKTEELLKEKDEMLRMKEEKLLQAKGKEQEKLQMKSTKFPYSSIFERQGTGQERKEGRPKEKASYGVKTSGTRSRRRTQRQEAEKEETKKKKKERDPLKSKQSMSAFFLFSNERRAALLAENKNVLEVAKITGEEWKNMSEEERGPYEEMAKKKYMQEMEVYKLKKIGRSSDS